MCTYVRIHVYTVHTVKYDIVLFSHFLFFSSCFHCHTLQYSLNVLCTTATIACTVMCNAYMILCN